MPNSQPPVFVHKAELFRTLGHPARIRILQFLRDGERTVGDLQAALDLDSSGTSQHLAALRKQDLVETRRQGTNVYYRVKDPRILDLLQLAKEILTSRFEESRTLLADLAGEDFQPSRSSD